MGRRSQATFLYNIRPSLFLLVLPLLVGALTIGAISTGLYTRNLADAGSERLVTPGWDKARDLLLSKQPDYERKYAFYQIKPGQTIESIAAYFGIKTDDIAALNPKGRLVAGTHIKIPVIQTALTPTSGPNGQLANAIVEQDGNMLRVINKYDGKRQPVITTIPELAAFLAPHNVIEKVGDKTYRINKAFSLDGNIRLDITRASVTKLELRSSPNDITCLCMDESLALIDGVEITSYDPATKQPDKQYTDGRSFVRMKNGRLDVLNSKITYLGNGLRNTLTKQAAASTMQKEGGVYGISWRISDDQLGSEIATGWIENSVFEKNHFGSYTYGASGMVWRGNHFVANDVYGLDPHDDSNNALIENNYFERNGKHGFIVSKRCNYNVIRNNTSDTNKLHGFMLHQDSAYNLIENNISYGNVDNFVIYDSNFNTIRDNVSYNAKSSHVRINKPSGNNFVTGNKLYGGNRGIYLYDEVLNTYIANNTIQGTEKHIQTAGARNTVFFDNIIDALGYDIAKPDRFVFGPNWVETVKYTTPAKPGLPKGYRL